MSPGSEEYRLELLYSAITDLGITAPRVSGSHTPLVYVLLFTKAIRA